jgi:DNA-binding NarL/FixJ family response regulator
MAEVVAYLDDIFFQAKIVETARHLGLDLSTCATLDAFTAELAKAPALLLIDLNARANPFEAIGQAKAAAASVPMITFYSHVQTELADRARAAGCTNVMPRSKFTRDLATILAAAKSHS